MATADDSRRDTLEQIVASEISDAVSFADSDIGYQRAQATRYYQGMPFGDEEDGRSQVVSRDVADTVNQIIPSLMRVFFGPDNVVEFAPQTADDVEIAEQATDYLNYIFTRDNPGFEICYAAFKDALVRKCGVVKYWWDDSEETRTVEYSGLDDDSLTKLLEDLQAAQKADIISSSQDENGVSVTIRLTKRRDRVRIEALPPEEFLIDRRARTIDDATFVAHRCMKTVSELVAMGYDKDEVEAVSQDADDLRFNQQVQARNPYVVTYGNPGNDPSQRLVLYVEGYIRSDQDGDGIAELRRVCAIGPSHKLIHDEEVEDRNFAAFHCDPEPHTFFGQSIADKTMDVQQIKSRLLRTTLDSLALSIFPRTVVNTTNGNMQDAANTEIGALLRAKGDPSSAYFPLVTPDVSQNAYQALTYMDQVKETRTGMNRVSQGLDPSTLQNMTATASSAQFTQSQQHIELIARIFAETGMKRMFRGILKLVVENQRQARMVQLRNKWVPVDPRAWRVDMEVICNVALGGGTNVEKMNLLAKVMEKQENVITEFGLDNPMVGLPEYHNAMSQFLALGGFKNGDMFFKDPGDQKPPPKPPPPEAMKAQADAATNQAKAQTDAQRVQIEGQKAQAAAEESAQRLELERQKLAGEQMERGERLRMEKDAIARKEAREDLKVRLDTALKLADINSRSKTQITVADIKAKSDELRVHADLAIQAQESADARILADKDDDDDL